LYALLISPHVLYMPHPFHPPWFDHPNTCLMKSTNYEAPHYTVFLATCHFILLGSKFSLASRWKTSSMLFH
jgi:hypothetical protein